MPLYMVNPDDLNRVDESKVDFSKDEEGNDFPDLDKFIAEARTNRQSDSEELDAFISGTKKARTSEDDELDAFINGAKLHKPKAPVKVDPNQKVHVDPVSKKDVSKIKDDQFFQDMSDMLGLPAAEIPTVSQIQDMTRSMEEFLQDRDKYEGFSEMVFKALPKSFASLVWSLGRFFLYDAPKSALRIGFAMGDKIANTVGIDGGQARQGESWYQDAYWNDPVTGMQIPMKADPQDKEILDEAAALAGGWFNLLVRPLGMEIQLVGGDEQRILGGTQEFDQQDAIEKFEKSMTENPGQDPTLAWEDAKSNARKTGAHFQGPSLHKAYHNWTHDFFGTAFGALLLLSHSSEARSRMRTGLARALRSGDEGGPVGGGSDPLNPGLMQRAKNGIKGLLFDVEEQQAQTGVNTVADYTLPKTGVRFVDEVYRPETTSKGLESGITEEYGGGYAKYGEMPDLLVEEEAPSTLKSWSDITGREAIQTLTGRSTEGEYVPEARTAWEPTEVEPLPTFEEVTGRKARTELEGKPGREYLPRDEKVVEPVQAAIEAVSETVKTVKTFEEATGRKPVTKLEGKPESSTLSKGELVEVQPEIEFERAKQPVSEDSKSQLTLSKRFHERVASTLKYLKPWIGQKIKGYGELKTKEDAQLYHKTRAAEKSQVLDALKGQGDAEVAAQVVERWRQEHIDNIERLENAGINDDVVLGSVKENRVWVDRYNRILAELVKVDETLNRAQRRAEMQGVSTVKQFKQRTGVTFYTNGEMEAAIQAAARSVDFVKRVWARKKAIRDAKKIPTELHHDLPVGKTLEHLDWHLRNLWEGGWRTMRKVTTEEHREIHGKKGVGSMVRTSHAGQKGWSPEALNRLASWKRRGVELYKVDARTGKQTPILMTAEIIDNIKVGDFEFVYATKLGREGGPLLLEKGSKVNRARATRLTTLNRVGGGLPLDLMGQMAKQGWQRAKNFRNTLADILDMEDRYHRLGAPLTGWFMKIRPSVEAMFETQGLQHAKRWALEARDALFPDKKFLNKADRAKLKEDLYQATLAAESDIRYRSAKGHIKSIAKQLRKIMADAKRMLKERGLDYDFKARMEQELRHQLEVFKKQGETKKAQDTELALERLKDYEFVHIPISFLMERWLRDPAQRGKTIKLLNSRKRQTPNIHDMVEELGMAKREDFIATNVVASYYRRLGRDVALQDIMNAGRQEGLVSSTMKQGFIRLKGFEAPKFAREWMHRAFADHLKQVFIGETMPMTTLGKMGRKYDSFVNYTKMLAFYNPIFLPMYDLVQAAMAFGLRDVHQMPKHLVKAWKDVRNRSEDYYEAQSLGVSSKPFANRIELWHQFLERIDLSAQEVIAEALRTQISRLKDAKGFERIPILPDVYRMSWYWAWELDSVVRQATYNYLKQSGKSPAESAQMAALFHGDYASVPTETRRWMNRFLFTPTFKIAMLKLYKRMMMDIPKYAKGDYAKGITMAFAIQASMDAVMVQALGFKRDQFGRRYVKDVTNDDGVVKELVMVFSNPTNILNKFYNRFKVAYHTPTPITSILKTNLTEFTPFLRTMIEVATGESLRGGTMYNWELDNGWYIMKKAIPHSLTGLVGIMKHMPGFSTLKEKESKEFYKKEFGSIFGAMAGLVSFAYTRDPKNVRIYRKVMKVEQDFFAYVQKRILEGEEWEPDRVKNFQKQIDYILKDLEGS